MTVFYICLILSLVSFCAGVLYLIRNRKEGWNRLLFGFLLYFALSLFLIRIPVCYDSMPSETALHIRLKSTFSGAFIHMLQSFSLDEDYDQLFDVAMLPWSACENPTSFIALFYSTYLVILDIIAPLMSGSLILSLISRFIVRIRLKLYGRRKKYIFSEINEITVSQGESIRSSEAGLPKRERSVLIYTDSDLTSESEKQAEFLGKLEALNALCVQEDISHLSIKHDAGVPVTLVLASADEDLNIRNAAKLLDGDKWSDCVLTNMFIYASEGESEIIVQNLINDARSGEKKRRWANLRIISVDKATMTVEQLLVDVPMYTRMTPGQCSVLILGGGDVNEAALKIISWCAQMDRTHLCIRLIDRNAAVVEHRLRKTAPLLFDNPEYDIHFYACEIFSNEFSELIRTEAADANYVLVALGSDSNSIRASLDLQRQYNILHLDGSPAPVIRYLVGLPELSHAMMRESEDPGDISRCLMRPFGDARQTCNLEYILQSRLEKMALAVHLTYYGMPLYLPPDDISFLQRMLSSGHSFVGTGGDTAGISKRYEYMLQSAYLQDGRLRRKRTSLPLSPGEQTRFDDLRSRLSDREQAINNFYDSVYNRASSRSSATHLVYYFPGTGSYPEAGLPSEAQSAAFAKALADSETRMRISRVEHLRWNAFMASQGYRCPTEAEFMQYAYIKGNKHDNKPLRLHPCICKWDDDKGFVLVDADFDLYEQKDECFMSGRYRDQLDELDRVSLIVSAHPLNKKKKVNYKTLDRVIIEAACQILSIRDGGKMIL